MTFGWLEIGMLSVAALAFVLFLHIFNQVPQVRELPRATRVGFALFAACAVVYGGGKTHGRVTVDDPYITNAGSYLTNDLVHVSIAKRSSLLPDDTEIIVYARELSQTNAEDWVRLTPYLAFADHPYDYPLPNATNHNVMVAASYSPGPTVHTNGVWSVNGFLIPNSGNKFGFKQSKTSLKEDNE